MIANSTVGKFPIRSPLHEFKPVQPAQGITDSESVGVNERTTPGNRIEDVRVQIRSALRILHLELLIMRGCCKPLTPCKVGTGDEKSIVTEDTDQVLREVYHAILVPGCQVPGCSERGGACKTTC